MTFEEYADKHLGKHGFKDVDLTLIRMGWNARGEFGSSPEKPDNSGNPQGFLDGSDHFAEASKMVQGNVALMGNVTDEDGTTYHKALVVQFSTVEDFRAAMKAGQCRFTVFGGDV